MRRRTGFSMGGLRLLSILPIAGLAILLIVTGMAVTATASISGTVRAGLETQAVTAPTVASAAGCTNASAITSVVDGSGGGTYLTATGRLILGGSGSETFDVSGDSNCVIGGGGADTITITGTNSYQQD
jgi:hypothetical protein